MLDPSSDATAGRFQPAIEGNKTQPFEVIDGQTETGLILLCDHASNAMPAGYGTLGLGADQLERHIAYDIGAAALTRGLAEHLGVPAILSRYSRLFIDLNRGADDPTLVMRLSDGAVIPGNRNVDGEEVARRIATYHRPYHDAVDQLIDRGIAHGTRPALLSVHSFTPRWKSVERPWDITVLWDNDARLPHPLLDALRQEKGLCVDENEPYSGNLTGDCMHQHGTARGLAHALIEVRQDLIADKAGQREWIDRLTRIMTTLWRDHKLLTKLRENRPNDRHTNTPNV